MMNGILSWKTAAVLAVLVLLPPRLEAKGRTHHKKLDEKRGTSIFADDINPQVLEKLLKDNPGLSAKFLENEPSDKLIKLADGKEWPLYQLTQFLNHNFRLEMKAAKMEGVELIRAQNWKMHRLMARPEFREWFKEYHKTYKVHNKSVGWHEAYSFIRKLHNTVQVGVTHPGQMPHGGGGHAMAPSWAVWKKMNLLYHEVANATPGFSGDDPVLTGVLAGHLEKMDKKKLWKYPTVDVNTLEVTNPQPPVTGFDSVDKGVHKKKKKQ